METYALQKMEIQMEDVNMPDKALLVRQIVDNQIKDIKVIKMQLNQQMHNN